MSVLRKLASAVAATPLHPQWLLGARKPPAGLAAFRGRLLDIGAADRWLESRLPAGVDYIALDYPETGRRLYDAWPDVHADAARLPFADGCLDGVACLEVIEHVPEPGKVLEEIARVLRPGGRAWLSMPFLYPVHDAPHDFQRFTEHGFRHRASAAGLELVTLDRSGHALRTAGLLACLALAGGLLGRGGLLPWLLAPVLAVAVLAINLSAWVLSLFWPDWPAMAIGHELELRKP